MSCTDQPFASMGARAQAVEGRFRLRNTEQISLSAVWRSAKVLARYFSSGVQPMNGVIYLVGLIVVVLAILSFVGLR
jgi:hypothetical protein